MVKPEISDVFIFSPTLNQFVIFDVILFPLATFMLFHDLSHKNAWINYTIPPDPPSGSGCDLSFSETFRSFFYRKFGH